jgi:hypothetical protein
MDTARSSSGGSPFAQGGDPGSQSTAARESPRLSILHLMIGTFCVAVYLGWRQVLYRVMLAVASSTAALPQHPFDYRVAGWVVSSTLSGIAMSGLLLWGWRRWRLFPFPQYPGEVLWIVAALLRLIEDLVELVRIVAVWPAWIANGAQVDRIVIWTEVAVWLAIWIGAVVAVRDRRWRATLVILAAADLLVPLAAWIILRRTGPTGVERVHLVQDFSTFLGVVVLTTRVVWDHLAAKRYPWTHWTGVGVLLGPKVLSLGVRLLGILGGS